jgi:hypothetical protein
LLKCKFQIKLIIQQTSVELAKVLQYPWIPLLKKRWVAHTREEVRSTAAREADRPAIGHKTWQAENPDDRFGRTRPTSACHCSSPCRLPTNCGAPFSTLPDSTSFIVQLRAPACTPACIP